MRTFCAFAGLLILIAASAFGQDSPKKLSPREAQGAAITKVQPDYPQIARQLKIQGVVELEALIGEDGSVQQVKIVTGNPVLTKPASEALQKWRFKAFTEDGKPVKAVAPVTFSFSL